MQFELTDQTRKAVAASMERRKVGERDSLFDEPNRKDRPGPVIPAPFTDDRYAPPKAVGEEQPRLLASGHR